MKCLKFNAKSTKAAQRAMVGLSELGSKFIGGASEPLCVVFWDDNTHCADSAHESEPSGFAPRSTEFFTKRKEFIAAVKRVLGESE